MRVRIITLFISLTILLCGCNNYGNKIKKKQMSININEKNFSIADINEGIADTFNYVLYYYGGNVDSEYLTDNKEKVLNREIEYDLYYTPNAKGQDDFVFASKVYFVIKNIKHPLSSLKNEVLYEFGIEITEYGLRSDFCYQGHIKKGEKYSFITAETIPLGSHSLFISEIKKPNYEKIDKEQKTNIEKSICLYMSNNNFYSDKNKNLPSGNYTIYLQNFFRSDKDSFIIFENEEGAIYKGIYYFVHEISGNSSADLNYVDVLTESNTKAMQSYLNKVRSDAVVKMEFIIR